MAGDDHAAVDGFIRFLLPAPKPHPAAPSPSSRLLPPHSLVARPLALPRPHPEERLFIVPPTRPDWLPPPPPPGTGLKPRPPNEHRIRNADRVAWNGSGNGRRERFPVPFPANGRRERIPVAFPPNGGGRAGPETRRVAVHKNKDKKAWVAVEKKGEGAGVGDEDQAGISEGYSDGDEGDDQFEVDGEQEGSGCRQRPNQIGGEKNSLAVPASVHESGGEQRPIENLMPQSIQAPRRMRGRQVECRHDIDTLALGLTALYESLKPSEEQQSKQQQQLVDCLTKTVSEEWPNAQLHLYGSCANSFGTSHSDVDVCLQMEIDTGSTVEIILRLAEILRNDSFENVEAITSARVPIVRMSDPGSGFACDICINNLFAVANTKLLKDYAQIDQRLLQLAFLVKHWAKLRGVNETYRGTLSSYAYVIMCIHFLQLRKPKILPCLQAMEPTYALNVDGTECTYFDEVNQLQDFSAENKESIAKLLWEFFHYWAFHHDYKNDVISVRLGKTITKQEKKWTTRVGNDRHLICIEDPFEIGHDLGRVVDRQTIRILREEFERAAAMLQYDHDPCVTLFEPYTL